jgi:hypothetical protein
MQFTGFSLGSVNLEVLSRESRDFLDYDGPFGIFKIYCEPGEIKSTAAYLQEAGFETGEVVDGGWDCGGKSWTWSIADVYGLPGTQAALCQYHTSPPKARELSSPIRFSEYRVGVDNADEASRLYEKALRAAPSNGLFILGDTRLRVTEGDGPSLIATSTMDHERQSELSRIIRGLNFRDDVGSGR